MPFKLRKRPAARTRTCAPVHPLFKSNFLLLTVLFILACAWICFCRSLLVVFGYLLFKLIIFLIKAKIQTNKQNRCSFNIQNSSSCSSSCSSDARRLLPALTLAVLFALVRRAQGTPLGDAPTDIPAGEPSGEEVDVEGPSPYTLKTLLESLLSTTKRHRKEVKKPPRQSFLVLDTTPLLKC